MEPIEHRVAARYVQARTDAVLDDLADHLVDALFDELGPNPISEQDVSKALQEGGLSAEDVSALSDGKQAGGFLNALGGLVARGLWRLIVQPFLALGKVFRSPAFRSEVKNAFKKAIRRDVRATKHVLDVARRLALAEPVKPQELKAAVRQLLDILARVLFLYFTGPGVAAMFSGGVWPALSKLMVPVGEVVVVLLDKPIRGAMAKLMTADLERMPFQLT
jgi:hypothetical protein